MSLTRIKTLIAELADLVATLDPTPAPAPAPVAEAEPEPRKKRGRPPKNATPETPAPAPPPPPPKPEPVPDAEEPVQALPTQEELVEMNREELDALMASFGYSPDEFSEAEDDDIRATIDYICAALSQTLDESYADALEVVLGVLGYESEADLNEAIEAIAADMGGVEGEAPAEEAEDASALSDYEAEALALVDQEIKDGSADWDAALIQLREFAALCDDEEIEALGVTLSDLEGLPADAEHLRVPFARMISCYLDDAGEMPEQPYLRNGEWWVDGFPLQSAAEVSEGGYDIDPDDKASAADAGISQTDVDAAVADDGANVCQSRDLQRLFVVVPEMGVVSVIERPKKAAVTRGRPRAARK